MESKELTVREVMQSDPVRVHPTCPVADVMSLMNRLRIGAVLVMEDEKLIGIFAERDLLRRLPTALPGWRDYPVSHWMTPQPHTITPQLSWEDAAATMHKLRVRHLPVLEQGRVIGVVSTRSLMAKRAEYLDQTITQRMQELRRAYDQLLARDGEMTYNLRAAGRLQTRLMLPHAPPAWPELDWAIHFAPLAHLGGDYYDFAQPSPDLLGFFIADASGHSIPATMLAIMTRIAFSEVAAKTPHPGEVLNAINERLSGITEERFVTAFYGILNRKTNELLYSSAGHPYPLLVRPQEGLIKPLSAQGFLLGIMPEEVYIERSVTLNPGDHILFYTDGLTEARNEIGEMFGMDRVTACLQKHGCANSAELLACVRQDQENFIGTQPMTDDLTAVVMGINPAQ